MKLIIAIFCASISLGLTATFAQAQTKTPAKATIQSVLDDQLTLVEHDFISAAEAMPEDKYSFAPSAGEFKGVRTLPWKSGTLRSPTACSSEAFLEISRKKEPAGMGQILSNPKTKFCDIYETPSRWATARSQRLR